MFHQVQRQQNMQTITETPIEQLTRVKTELLQLADGLAGTAPAASRALVGVTSTLQLVIDILTTRG